MSFEKYNSAKHVDILTSILDSKKNKILISNVSNKLNLNNKLIISEPHIFYEYEELILKNCVEVVIYEKFFYRPEYLSKELYGTPDLWYLLLWINKMTSIHDFNKLTINVFNPDKTDIINDIIEKNKNRFQKNKLEPKYIEDLTIKKIII
jgi:hypothetical protein